MDRRQLPFELFDERLVEADRHQVLERASVVADDADAGNPSLVDVTGSGGDVTKERGRIALGHQALRLLEQERQAAFARVETAGLASLLRGRDYRA